MQSSGEPAGTNLRLVGNRPRRPVTWQSDRVENTPTEEIATPTHRLNAPTKNADIVVLELFIYSTPGQATSDYGGARSRIVCHLGESSSVDVDSLG